MNAHAKTPRSHIRSLFAGVAIVATTTLIVTTLSGAPAYAAGDPKPDLGKPVPGTSASKLPDGTTADTSLSSPVASEILAPSRPTTIDLGSGKQSKAIAIEATEDSGATTVLGHWMKVGSTGIAVAAAKEAKAGAKTSTDVTATIVDKKTAAARGLSGLVIKLEAPVSAPSAPVAVSIPAKYLESQFGADYGNRVRWVQVPATGKTVPLSAATTVPSSSSSKSVTATPTVQRSAVMMAAVATATSSTGTGSFTATPLKAAGAWDVSTQTGDFNWSYPMTVPSPPAGPTPDVGVVYDSQSVDGETGSTNNQPSAVGAGWTATGSGFIERSYATCAQDTGASGAKKDSGDLCWAGENATLALGGHSGKLVRDTATGIWRLADDDGSRIEKLTGTAAGCAPNGTYDTSCWRLTTTDGTQYWFGRHQLPGWATGKPVTNSAWTVPVFGNDAGEPCNAAAFVDSSCMQGWRWNLDYVVDVHGNAEAFYYHAETNKYAQYTTGTAKNTTYTRGGQLDRIEYGLTASTVYTANAATNRVVYGYDDYGRCSDTSRASCTKLAINAAATTPATPSAYPDVPFDQLCTGTCTGKVSPTFFTNGMLNTITTQYRSGTTYANVDSWKLGHSFPSPGDGTNPVLWLTDIVRTGYAGTTTLAEPATTFVGVPMQNRVWAVDGLAPLVKYRISSITNSAGAVTSVNYSAKDCTPAEATTLLANVQNNDRRCFPQWWSPEMVPAQEPKLDLFHKYVVTSVIADPKTGGGNDTPRETYYVYTGKPGWKYDDSTTTPANRRTWSRYAGYDTVEERTGSATTPALQQTTAYTYYRGMDGDRAAPAGGTKSVAVTGFPGVVDSAWFAGQLRSEKTLNGVGGAVLSETITTPYASAVRANDGTNTSRFVDDASEVTTAPLSTGGTQRTETSTQYEATYGLATSEQTSGTGVPTTCTQTTYAPANTTAWLIGLPQETRTTAAACADVASAVYPRDAISAARTLYDGLTLGQMPTKGLVSSGQTVETYTGTTAASARWVTSRTTTYDAMGRSASETDALGRKTTTSFTPTTGGPVTGMTTTNPAPYNWASSTTFDPARGLVLSATDQNNRVITATYDALGRRTAAWFPGRPQASNTTPSIAFAYSMTRTAPSSVATTTLTSTGTSTSFSLYDGLGDIVQTQSPAYGGGSVITDSQYDAAGRVWATNNAYWTTTTAPSGALFVPDNQQQIASRNSTVFDGAGRATASITSSYGKERYRATNAYPGADRVDTTPPAGGVPTTSITDALGRQTKLIQYEAATPTASAVQQATTYAYDTRGAMTGMTDPVGNAWSWSFDVMGRMVTSVDPDSGTSSYTYDLAGRKLSSTDARGVTLTTAYDTLDRTTAQYEGTASGKLLNSWTYDSLAKGSLTSASSYEGSQPGTPGSAYTSTVTGYDAAGRPTGSTLTLPTDAPAFAGLSYKVALYYNQDGTLATQSNPKAGDLPAENLRYSYDGLGGLTGLSGAASYGGVVYNAIGQVAQYNRYGTTPAYSTYGYDPADGAVLQISEQTGTGANAVKQSIRTYTRNDIGDVLSATNVQPTTTDTQCYRYDSLRQLTEAWTAALGNCTPSPTTASLGGPASYWNSYNTDRATGNRLSTTAHSTAGDTTSTYAYPAAGSAHPHAVTSVTTTNASGTATASYGYDAAGGTTARPDGQSLAYDQKSRLSSITIGDKTQRSIYGPDGSLLMRIDPTEGATLFLGDTELRTGSSGSSAVTAVRTYSLGGTPIAERTSTSGSTTGTLAWLATDLNGTADMQVDVATGKITRRYSDPYGNTRGTPVAWTSKHGFLNAPESAFGKLTQLGARAYDATLGRFLSVDAVLAPANPLQNNGYSYSANNPVTYADPSGNCALGVRDDCRGNGTKRQGGINKAVNNGATKGKFLGYSVKARQLSYSSTPKNMRTDGYRTWMRPAPAAKPTREDIRIAQSNALAEQLWQRALQRHRTSNNAAIRALAWVADFQHNHNDAIKATVSVAAFASVSAGASVPATTGSSVTVWRTVGTEEAASLAASGRYSLANGLEGKYFFTSRSDAVSLAQKYESAGIGDQTLTRGSAPKSVVANAEPMKAAGEGPGLYIRGQENVQQISGQLMGRKSNE